jgi:hypothetical protein
VPAASDRQHRHRDQHDDTGRDKHAGDHRSRPMRVGEQFA